jgi:hypothetical protein
MTTLTTCGLDGTDRPSAQHGRAAKAGNTAFGTGRATVVDAGPGAS